MPKFFNKKTATVRFHGFNEEKKYQNSKSDIIVSKRLIELIAVTLVLIFILIVRLAYVQLTQADTLEEYEKAIQTKSIILFTASWCPDCMFIKPFIGNVVKKYPNFTFYSINRDHFIDLCQDLDILGIPSFVSYENGQAKAGCPPTWK